MSILTSDANKGENKPVKVSRSAYDTRVKEKSILETNLHVLPCYKEVNLFYIKSKSLELHKKICPACRNFDWRSIK